MSQGHLDLNLSKIGSRWHFGKTKLPVMVAKPAAGGPVTRGRSKYKSARTSGDWDVTEPRSGPDSEY